MYIRKGLVQNTLPSLDSFVNYIYDRLYSQGTRKVEQYESHYVRKETRLSTVGFDTWHEFGDMMAHRVNLAM